MVYFKLAIFILLFSISTEVLASVNEVNECIQRIIQGTNERVHHRDNWVVARIRRKAIKSKIKNSSQKINKILAKSWNEITEEEIQQLKDLIRLSGSIFQKQPEIIKKVLARLKQIRTAAENLASEARFSPNALKDLKKIERKASDIFKEKVIHRIIANPSIGKMKTSIPKEFRFLHFRTPSGYYIAAYTYDDVLKKVTFHMIAPHENFYQIFKRRHSL